MKTVWSILVAIFLFSIPAFAQVPQIEREALIALYNSTDGDNWLNNPGWKTPPLHSDGFALPGTEPAWYGITCNDGDNWVVEIVLTVNQLSGIVPPELGGLSNLAVLDLNYNELSGMIPPELGNLSNLTTLNLRDNQLSGSIPLALGNLSNLGHLSLGYNELNGVIPSELGNLANLTYLEFFRNRLSGSIPPELGNLSNLTRLSFETNQLSGNIPPELGNLSNLTNLNLRNNELIGIIPPELGGLSNLAVLDLNNNELSGMIPPELGNLSNLNALDLGGNALTGAIPSEIGNLSNLTVLWLRSNALAGSIPPEIGDLSNLSQMNLDYNALWTNDIDLQAYLDTIDPSWSVTQTIAPEGLVVISVSDRTAWLEWTPVAGIFRHGGYEFFSTEVGGQDPTSAGYSVSRETSTFPVTGLQPGQTFDLVVKTVTWPHRENKNWVYSDPTVPVMATTSNTGCETPTVSVSGESAPYALTVTSNHDTFEWVTGEQTASISVTPHWATWYWVKTTGIGGCEEAAVAFAADELVFTDDFESGNFWFWSY